LKLFDCLSIGFLLVLSVNTVIIFYLAFLNDYVCLVNVNTFREGYIEAVLFPLWVVMGIVTFVRMIKRSD